MTKKQLAEKLVAAIVAEIPNFDNPDSIKILSKRFSTISKDELKKLIEKIDVDQK
jgi:hypothetical protein